MSLTDTFETVEVKLHGVLVRHGITALRVTVGLVFVGFGLLKFFPRVSPAEGLAIKTIDRHRDALLTALTARRELTAARCRSC